MNTKKQSSSVFNPLFCGDGSLRSDGSNESSSAVPPVLPGSPEPSLARRRVISERIVRSMFEHGELSLQQICAITELPDAHVSPELTLLKACEFVDHIRHGVWALSEFGRALYRKENPDWRERAQQKQMSDG